MHLVGGRAGNEPARPRRRARAGAGQGVSLQGDQGDGIAPGSRLRSARASPPSRPGRRCPRAATRSPDVGLGGPPPPSGIPVSDHLLEAPSAAAPDDVAGGLGLDRHRLAGERVLPRPRLGGGLAHHLELQESGDDELTGALLAQLLGDQRAQGGEDGGDLLLAQPGRLGQTRCRPRSCWRAWVGRGPACRRSWVGPSWPERGWPCPGRPWRPERWRPCPGWPSRPERGRPCPGRPWRPERGWPCPGRPWVRLSWPWSLGRSGTGWKASIESCGPGRAGSPGQGPDEDRSVDDLIPYRKTRSGCSANPPLSPEIPRERPPLRRSSPSSQGIGEPGRSRTALGPGSPGGAASRPCKERSF